MEIYGTSSLFLNGSCRCTVSIRDLLSWVNFMNVTSSVTDHSMDTDSTTNLNQLTPPVSYVHGACLVFLDSLGSGLTENLTEPKYGRKLGLEFLLAQINKMSDTILTLESLGLEESKEITAKTISNDLLFGVHPFTIERGRHSL